MQLSKQEYFIYRNLTNIVIVYKFDSKKRNNFVKRFRKCCITIGLNGHRNFSVFISSFFDKLIFEHINITVKSGE